MKFEKTYRVIFAIGALVVLPAIAAAQPQPCWRLTAVGQGPTVMCEGDASICVEWGSDSTGYALATTCCHPDHLPDACHSICQSLERPLLTGTIPSPTLPESGPALKALAESPIRPQIAVTFRGREYRGDELRALDAKELHYLFVLDDGNGKSVLFAFEDRAELGPTLNKLNRSEDPSLRQRLAQGHPGGVSLFADEKWQHAHYYLAAGGSVDFRQGWWAKKVSSVRGTGVPTWLTLFAGPDYSGPSLTVSTAWDRPNLAAFGWDDRASSAYVWPREPGARKPLDLVKPLF